MRMIIAVLLIAFSASALAVDYTQPLPSNPAARDHAALESFHLDLTKDRGENWIRIASTERAEWWFSRRKGTSLDENQPTLHLRFVKIKEFHRHVTDEETRVLSARIMIGCETNVFFEYLGPDGLSPSHSIGSVDSPLGMIRQIVCKE